MREPPKRTTREFVANPQLAAAYKQKALLYRSEDKVEEAVREAERAIVFKPTDPELLVLLIDLHQRLYDWKRVDELDQKLCLLIEQQLSSPGPGLITPFQLLSLPKPISNELHFHYSKLWAASFCIEPPVTRPTRLPSSNRLRIGYLSADFGHHPVGYCIVEAIESHDRERFEVYGYSMCNHHDSEITRRIRGAFDTFRDVESLSLRDTAELIARDEIDILVDLHGHTESARTPILAMRPAPIQVNYLGYPATTGADYMDYIFVDEYTVPPSQQAFFSEQLVHLPGCYLPHDSQRPQSARQKTRREAGLPDNAFVFCGFTSPSKLNQSMFDRWLRILNSTPNSVLWLRSSHPIGDDNLRRYAAAHNVDLARLIFAPIVSMEDHLGRIALADLYLDTFPYNQHSTAQDALAMRVPLLTCKGSNFSSRVAGSLLTTLGLPDLIATSPEHYESTAIRIANAPLELESVRHRLHMAIANGRLGNGRVSASKLEAAYTAMAERAKTGNASKDMINTWLTQAREEHAAGSYATAESMYRRILAFNPNHADTLHSLGILLWQSDQKSDGLQSVRRAVAICPEEPLYQFNLGVIYESSNRIDDAVACWREAVRLNQDYREAWTELARITRLSSDRSQSLEPLEQLVRLDPMNVETCCNLADTYAALRRHEQAEATYRRTLQISPEPCASPQ